jgi:hypothetical protein
MVASPTLLIASMSFLTCSARSSIRMMRFAHSALMYGFQMVKLAIFAGPATP